jgi:hypothetical protein
MFFKHELQGCLPALCTAVMVEIRAAWKCSQIGPRRAAKVSVK